MSSINGVGGSAAYQFAQKTPGAQASKPASDPDHDGDNDAGVSKAQESAEQALSQSIRTASGAIDTRA
jgi:hypothetical protein